MAHRDKGPVINKKTLSEQTYTELSKMIMNQVFSPGEKITEDQIAKILGVSRTTVKKAFTALVQEGILEDIPRRGVFLRTYSKEERLEIYDIREVTAGLSARYATLNMSRRDLNSLEEIYRQMEDAVHKQSRDIYAHFDLEFHDAIVRFSGSSILYDVISNLNLRLMPFNRVNVQNIEETLKEHRNILDSMQKGNPEEAEKYMRYHISRAREKLTTNIDKTSVSAEKLIQNEDPKEII